MLMRKVLPVFAGLLLAGSVFAADTGAKAPSEKQLAQQQKMTDCNKQATSKSLKGDERKTFMSSCLKAGSHPGADGMTPQQQKMKSCNTEAAGKSLKGDERKTFMSACLKKK